MTTLRPALATAALLAATFGPTAASAATVTLLSQERSVELHFSLLLDAAEVLPPARLNLQLLSDIEARSRGIAAEDFGRFDAEIEDSVLGEVVLGGEFSNPPASAGGRASQRSSIDASGSSVRFAAVGFATFSTSERDTRRLLSGSATSAFSVHFALDEAAGFLANIGVSEERDVAFSQVGFSLLGPNDEVVFSRDTVDLVEDTTDGGFPFFIGDAAIDGVLDAGVYELRLASVESGIGLSSFGFNLELSDSVLATSVLTPVPTPGAFTAGLALIAGGLLRRRRA